MEKINSNVQVLLLGDGKTKQDVINLIELKNLDKRIKVENPIPKENMSIILNNMTMSVITFSDLPEMQNNSANKFFDSLATGRPILVNFGGWINELVISNNCGIDGWRKPLKELAVEVHKKCNDKVWLEKAGKNSFNLGKKYFDRDIAAENLNKIFHSVLDGNNEISKFTAENYTIN